MPFEHDKALPYVQDLSAMMIEAWHGKQPPIDPSQPQPMYPPPIFDTMWSVVVGEPIEPAFISLQSDPGVACLWSQYLVTSHPYLNFTDPVLVKVGEKNVQVLLNESVWHPVYMPNGNVWTDTPEQRALVDAARFYHMLPRKQKQVDRDARSELESERRRQDKIRLDKNREKGVRKHDIDHDVSVPLLPSSLTVAGQPSSMPVNSVVVPTITLDPKNLAISQRRNEIKLNAPLIAAEKARKELEEQMRVQDDIIKKAKEEEAFAEQNRIYLRNKQIADEEHMKELEVKWAKNKAESQAKWKADAPARKIREKEEDDRRTRERDEAQNRRLAREKAEREADAKSQAKVESDAKSQRVKEAKAKAIEKSKTSRVVLDDDDDSDDKEEAVVVAVKSELAKKHAKEEEECDDESEEELNMKAGNKAASKKASTSPSKRTPANVGKHLYLMCLHCGDLKSKKPVNDQCVCGHKGEWKRRYLSDEELVDVLEQRKSVSGAAGPGPTSAQAAPEPAVTAGTVDVPVIPAPVVSGLVFTAPTFIDTEFGTGDDWPDSMFQHQVPVVTTTPHQQSVIADVMAALDDVNGAAT